MNWYKRSKIAQKIAQRENSIPELIPEPDQYLIEEVMENAGAGAIHKVYSWIGSYFGWAQLAVEALNKGMTEMFDKYKKDFQEIEKAMRTFLAEEKLKKVKR